MCQEPQLVLEERRHAVLKDVLLNNNVPGSAMLVLVSLSDDEYLVIAKWK
jgi:hypothetical protein